MGWGGGGEIFELVLLECDFEGSRRGVGARQFDLRGIPPPLDENLRQAEGSLHC